MLGREAMAAMAVPLTLPLFQPEQMKGDGLGQEESSVPAGKVRQWG